MADVAIEKRLHSPHSALDKKDSAYKRSNKPYMEKKRRARINNCLSQLKTLVLQAMRKDTNQYSKLEKADILEMTVKHLRQLQRQQVSHALSHDPSVMTKYKAGFTECANEVMRYLSSVQSIDEDVRGRLVNHLGNVVTQINTPEPQQCQAQPLNVQIPQQLNQGLGSVQTGCLLMPAGVQTSPLVIQQQQLQNIPNVYNHGHNNQSAQLTHQNQQQAQRLVSNGTQFSGSFQIVPTSSPDAAVAVYLGQTQSAQKTVQTSSPPQRSSSLATYPSNTPPRTKASLKAFDSSAFSQVPYSTSDKSNNSSPSCSPASSTDLSYMKTNLDLHMHGIAVNCGRTPSPLKVEDVWRPW